MVFLSAVDGVFMVELEPLQFKKLHVSCNWLYYYPFESVYTAGNTMPYTKVRKKPSYVSIIG